jgi:hypothetical protein
LLAAAILMVDGWRMTFAVLALVATLPDPRNIRIAFDRGEELNRMISQPSETGAQQSPLTLPTAMLVFFFFGAGAAFGVSGFLHARDPVSLMGGLCCGAIAVAALRVGLLGRTKLLDLRRWYRYEYLLRSR